MKKLLIIILFTGFSVNAQNPSLFRHGIDTKFIQLDTLTTSQRNSLTIPNNKSALIYNSSVDSIQYKMPGGNWLNIGGGSGGGAVSSVNGQTGTVVLDADDIDDSTTTNKFVTATQKGLIDTALQPSAISNEAYDATTWNGVDTIAPSKNAVRDKFASIDLTLDNVVTTNTNQSISGTKTMTGGFIILADGTSNSDALVFQGNMPSSFDNVTGVNIFRKNNNLALTLDGGLTNRIALLKGTSDFTAERTFTLPNKSGTIALLDDIAGGGTDDQTASEVPFTPYSTIAATNVQDAIEEVLDEIPTSLAAANITVSPSIGGNTDAYAVMDDHEDRIMVLESSSVGTSAIAMTNEQKLSKWMVKLKTSPQTAKIAFVGDSTSDLSGNASSLDDLIDENTGIGLPMQGFDIGNMLNFGSNGQTIVGFIEDSGTKGLEALGNANLDLIIFSYGINDIRQNNLTSEQLKDNIITCIEHVKTHSPETTIILRTPSSFDVPVDDTYIKQGDYSSLAEAAQAQSTILWKAYKELEFYWPDVLLFDTQELIYGKTSSPITPSVLHTDEIHPRYDPMVSYLLNNIIGIKFPFNEYLAKAAFEDSNTPWDIYPRVFEYENEFIHYGSGVLSAQGSGYAFIGTEVYRAYDIVSKSTTGDYISFANGKIVVEINDLHVGNNSRVDYYNTLPSNTLQNGDVVKFYRSRYNHTPLNRQYLWDKRNYPYRHRVALSSCGENYIRISELIDDNITTTEDIGKTAVDLTLTTGSIIVFKGATSALDLSEATFSVVGSHLNINVTGDFSDYTYTVAYIYSNEPL